MIVHRITPHAAPRETFVQQSKRYRGENGSDSHRLFIFERTLKHCKFKKGEQVLYKRNQYQIIHIDEDVEMVEWDGLSAKIITIWDDGDNMIAVHPNQLKRVR